MGKIKQNFFITTMLLLFIQPPFLWSCLIEPVGTSHCKPPFDGPWTLWLPILCYLRLSSAWSSFPYLCRTPDPIHSWLCLIAQTISFQPFQTSSWERPASLCFTSDGHRALVLSLRTNNWRLSIRMRSLAMMSLKVSTPSISLPKSRHSIIFARESSLS